MSVQSDRAIRRSAPARGPIVVPHEPWQAARDAILLASASRPRTITLVGLPGSGKTWLLREISQELTRRGVPTTLLLQGDLPFLVTEGAALLIDEADRMAAPIRAALRVQRDGLVVLAALEDTGGATVTLRPLERDAAIRFVSEWLRQAGEAAASLDKAALGVLLQHANGTPRLLVQLLTASLALSPAPRKAPISAADIEAVASLRLGGMDVRPPPSVRPPRRAGWWSGLAIAAGLTLAWIATERRARPPLPALQPALIVTPPLASVPPPPDVLPAEHPVRMATVPPPDAAPVPEAQPLIVAEEAPKRPVRPGGPGFVIVAQRGDTLESLYASIYRGVTPPDYRDVLAVNPRRFEPGAIIVFPEPPDGWHFR